MKILITGGAGFIGGHICECFVEEGHEVTVLDNLSSGSLENLERARELASDKRIAFHVLNLDITDPHTWEGIGNFDALVHLAAQTSVTASVKSPEFDFDQNVKIVPPMLNWVKNSSLKFVLYSNTAGAYYGESNSYPTIEKEAPRPRSPYGATKAFFEVYLQAVTSAWYDERVKSLDPKEENYLGWASLRLGNVYGPRQKSKGEAGVVPIFFEKFIKGEPVSVFGDGTKTRDYVFVSDVSSAFLEALRALANSPLNQGINIASGFETKDIEVVKTVQNELCKMLKPIEEMHHLSAQIDSLVPKFEKVRPGELMRSYLDIGLAKSMLNWSPRHSFNKGIQDTLDYYLSKYLRDKRQ